MPRNGPSRRNFFKQAAGVPLAVPAAMAAERKAPAPVALLPDSGKTGQVLVVDSNGVPQWGTLEIGVIEDGLKIGCKLP